LAQFFLNMNWIQQHILLELTKHAARRYSELRPDGVEGNLFLYHLDGLIKSGLVEKGDGAYRLSDKGRAQAATLSLASGKQRRQPIVITAVAARDESGRYLLFRWKRQPNVGLVSFPHGLAHAGVPLAEMAAVELAEKAGLEAELRFSGEASIIINRGDEADRHWLVHVFEADEWRELSEKQLRPEVGESFWASLDEVDQAEIMPGFFELAKYVDSRKGGELFFCEISV